MLVSAAIAFATEPLVVAALVVAASIAYGGFYTPGMALVADRAELAGLAQGIGFGVMNSAWAAGALLGPALGGALAQAFGDAVPYLACSVLCAVHPRRRHARRGAAAHGLTVRRRRETAPAPTRRRAGGAGSRGR